MKKSIAMIVLVVLSIITFVYCAAGIDYRYAQVETTKGPLNMREAASTKAAKIDEIPKGTIIAIVSEDNGWCECFYNEQEGYVMSKYLSFMDDTQFRTLSENDSGEDILALKERLQELYFFDADAEMDDQYGNDTVAALKLFQLKQGMEETGVASPELQALLFWGPVKNNLPTIKMTVRISSQCSGYNHVGNSWSQYYSINGAKVSSGDTLELVLGECITVYSKITERDKSPDIGSANEDVEITQEYFDNGFTITQKVTVKENKGRYSGNRAYWTVTYTFTP